MNPDAYDAEVGALAHDRCRGCRGREHQHRIDSAGDRLEIRIAGDALDGGRARVHRKDHVPGLLQFAEIEVGRLPGVARHADNSDALLREKIPGGFGEGGHASSVAAG